MKIIISSILIFFISNFNVSAQWTMSANFSGGFVNAIMTKENVIYAGTSLGVFRSDNNGVNWIQISNGFGNTLNVQCLSSKDNYIFAGTSSGGFFYSDNNGANWIQSNQGIAQQNIKTLTTDSDYVYAGCVFAGIFYSSNNGLNWTRFGLGEGDLLFSISYNETAFFAGIDGVIYTTTNSGVNWGASINGLTNLHVRTIVHSPTKTYCGTFGGGVFVSDNSGALWTPVSSGLTDLYIWTLAVHEENVLAGTLSDGIFFLSKSSSSWVPINDGLADSTIPAIATNDDFVFAGTSTGKVWRRPVSEIITGINNHVLTVEDFRLYQNYPNPFNPVTKLAFELPLASDIRLVVYDITGRVVETLVDTKLAAGYYEHEWNASSYSSGIYFYRISSGNFTDVKKMMLVK